ncbi:hypothetical protein DFA_01889 [Cavenderia fasciculata]|uniref:Ankyrin repeat-containing protein n=1 Tax=Cavenderia fasciculata TaxID=261658 RepID=F4PV92_CACFS|nr:uncharacterized protein DFA_01889 [Cavenderia fasciculata]EGG22000.1 hypothetical protein DFA_01889 [Cavenderia fasciculata]|eukprot:XP_004359851.1 hypothetical protein DFA_01889 [Cavenderia fasciculata]
MNSNELIIQSVFRNKYLIRLIGKEIEKINRIDGSIYQYTSYRFDNIPSLKWVVTNKTGDLLHQLCKRSVLLVDKRLPLSTLQVGWITLDSIIAICSPHLYNRSVAFKLETFDVIYNYYESAFKFEHHAVDSASASGNFELVKYLLDRGVPFTTDAIDVASRNGHLNIIKLLLNTNPSNHQNLFDDNIKFTNHSYDFASKNGHLNVLKFFDEIYQQQQQQKKSNSIKFGRVEFTTLAIDGAAENQHWDCVNHIFDLYGKDKNIKGYIFSEDALKWCISHNELTTLKKLLDYPHPEKKAILKSQEWVRQGIIEASEKGHIQVIGWVFGQKLLDMIPDDALLNAVKYDQVQTLQLYLQLNNDPKSSKTLRASFSKNIIRITQHAARSKSIGTIQYLFGEYQRASRSGTSMTGVLETSCRHGTLNILQWVLQQHIEESQLSGDWMTTCARIAGLNGQLEILQFFVESKRFQLKKENLEDCVSSASYECVEYVLSKGIDVSAKSITTACQKGLDRIVRLLLSSDTVLYAVLNGDNPQNYYNAALGFGSLECIQALGNMKYKVSGDDLCAAVQKGSSVPLVQFLITHNPSLLDPSQGQYDMVNTISNLLACKFYQMTEYILGLKCHSFNESLGIWEPTNQDRFTLEEHHFVNAANRNDVPMIEIILRSRPTVPCANANLLLSCGLINLYYRVAKRNEELGFDHQIVEQKPLRLFPQECYLSQAIAADNYSICKVIGPQKHTSLQLTIVPAALNTNITLLRLLVAKQKPKLDHLKQYTFNLSVERFLKDY